MDFFIICKFFFFIYHWRMNTTKTWNIGEVIAIKYLQSKWYIIRTTNFKFGRFWEIDIIAQIDWKTIFIEVKYRKSDTFWTPEESITQNKLRKFKKTIEYYCVKNRVDFWKIEFNVIAIQKKATNNRVTHYKNVEI